MPIFRIDTRLFHFAHVPKCAGSAVENYLMDRFGPLGFLDRRHLADPGLRWSRSSPQHIDVASLHRLLPPDFFAGAVAVVRHPVDRIVSLFRFQRDIERSLPEDAGFGAWLDDLPERQRENPFYLDNHPRPMTELVPDGAAVFRLEQGLIPLISWLDVQAGDSAGPRQVTMRGSYAQHLARHGRPAGPPVTVSAEDRQRIAALYAADFDRFGYDPAGGAEPAAAGTGMKETP